MTKRNTGRVFKSLTVSLMVYMVGCGGSQSGTVQKPQIKGFVAQPPIVRGSESSTLSWNVTAATSISIDNELGAVTGASGSIPVKPTATTTYTLTATNGSETATATATVTVATGNSYELPADRMTSWNLAGMLTKGGVPSATWGSCNETPLQPIGSGQDDSGAIQNLVDTCPEGTVVQLAKGTFTMGIGKFILIHRGVVLRGAGAGETILNNPLNQFPSGTITVDDGVQQNIQDESPIVIVGPQRWAGPDGDGRCNGLTPYDTHYMQRLTADAVKGTKSVTVGDGSIFQEGQIVLLDETSGADWQTDRAELSDSVWAAADYSVEWNQHSSGEVSRLTPSQENNWAGWWGWNAAEAKITGRPCWFSRHDRPQNEIKEIEKVEGNVITFTSPLHKDYRIAKYAELTTFTEGNLHVRNAGVEELTMTGGGNGTLLFVNAAYSWARNIEATRFGGGAVSFSDSFRVELRDSYLHDSAWPSPGGGGYVIDIAHGSSELLIENNISLNANKVMVAKASGSGSVVAYNYMNGGYIYYSTSWIECGLNASHMTGSHHVLFEGNQSFNLDSDDTHGNSTYLTYFRNYATSIREPFTGIVDIGTIDDANSDNGPKRAAGAMRYSYWMSYVGNVLGKRDLTTAANGYVDEFFSLVNHQPSIWMLGWNDTEPYTVDPNVAETAIRDGNWDWFLGEQTWLNASASMPRDLPSSLYLSQVPKFFGSNPWPWVDPATGEVYTLPAKKRLDDGTPNQVP